jgi:hypothetical protein
MSPGLSYGEQYQTFYQLIKDFLPFGLIGVQGNSLSISTYNFIKKSLTIGPQQPPGLVKGPSGSPILMISPHISEEHTTDWTGLKARKARK